MKEVEDFFVDVMADAVVCACVIVDERIGVPCVEICAMIGGAGVVAM